MSRIIVCALLSGLLVGCYRAPAPATNKDTPKDTPKATTPAAAPHPDKGLHGGVLVEWGDEEFHPEVLFDRAKKEATVNIHDGSAAKLVAIKVESINLVLTSEQPLLTIPLKAQPREGEKAGSSRFVGTHEKLAAPGKLKGRVEGTVDGKQYGGKFQEK